MNKIAFSPADILLPVDCGLTKWAVVACDQYTSQPEYWERVDETHSGVRFCGSWATTQEQVDALREAVNALKK
mgnify:CR=1 FL=1